jgi:hypothetical protein
MEREISGGDLNKIFIQIFEGKTDSLMKVT